jgi:hypothetical protein
LRAESAHKRAAFIPNDGSKRTLSRVFGSLHQQVQPGAPTILASKLQNYGAPF